MISKKRLYTGNILILGLNQLIEHIAFGIPYSYFPQYAISLGATVASIGLFTTSFMFVSAVLSPYLGAYSDRYGRKRFIVIGLLGDVIFGAMTGLVPSWEWLLIVRCINGAATAAAVLPAEAMLIDSAPPDRIGEATGFVMACGIVGREIGPLFGGTIQWLCVNSGLSELDSYRIPYFVDAAFAAISLLTIIFGIKESKVEHVKKVEAIENENRNDKRTKIPEPFKVLLVCAFISGIGEGFMRPIFVLLLSDVFGAEPIEIGVLASISGLVALLASYLSGKASDRFGRKIVIAVGGIPARILGSVVALSADLYMVSIFYTIRGFVFRIYSVGLRSLRADLAPPEVRGRLFGLYRTFFDVGDMVGPMMATYLYDVYRFTTFQVGGFRVPGYGIPFYLNSVIGLIAVAAILAFVKVEKHVN